MKNIVYILLLFSFLIRQNTEAQTLKEVPRSEYENYLKSSLGHLYQPKDPPQVEVLERHYFKVIYEPKQEYGDSIWLDLPILSDTTKEYLISSRGAGTGYYIALFCNKDSLIAQNYFNEKYYDGFTYDFHNDNACEMENLKLLLMTHNKDLTQRVYIFLFIYAKERRKK